MLYADHINLGFFRGAELLSRFPVLEGTGKGLRHVKVHTIAEARRPVIRRVVRAAALLDRTGPGGVAPAEPGRLDGQVQVSFPT